MDTKMEIPERIYMDPNVNYAAVATLSFLCSKINSKRDDNFVWWKITHIADAMAKKNPSAIRADIKSLENAGYLERCQKEVNGKIVSGFEVECRTSDYRLQNNRLQNNRLRSIPLPVAEQLSYTIGTKERTVEAQTGESTPTPMNGNEVKAPTQISLIEQAPIEAKPKKPRHETAEVTEMLGMFNNARGLIGAYLKQIGVIKSYREVKMSPANAELIKRAADKHTPDVVTSAWKHSFRQIRETREGDTEELLKLWKFWNLRTKCMDVSIQVGSALEEVEGSI